MAERIYRHRSDQMLQEATHKMEAMRAMMWCQTRQAGSMRRRKGKKAMNGNKVAAHIIYGLMQPVAFSFGNWTRL
jgi:hypothetical protein